MTDKARKRRVPKVITEQYLERSAVFYLQRYATTSSHLRDVLLRRVRKSVAYHGGSVEGCEPLVASVVASLCSKGLVDDRAYCRARVEELHRRGRSSRAIRFQLRGKGLPGPMIDEALALLAEESEDPELDAALHYARRRRLGPYRNDDAQRKERRQRDLAALARVGFSFGVAARVIDSLDPEGLVGRD